jgi:AAA family ATP:ADP antiporter
MNDRRTDDRSLLERGLGIVTEIEAGEGITAVVMTLNVFLLLTAYYVIKPVREALILAMESGPEYKSYMSGVIAVALLFAVPAYARVADRLPRNRLVVGVTIFFASNLVLFYVASLFPPVRAHLGLVFFAWVGIFNMMVVAQFWAFANDIYDEAQGKRVFVLIGLGQTLGAVAGAAVSRVIVEPLGVYQMLLVCAVLLAAFAGLTQLVHKREARRARPALDAREGSKKKPGGKEIPKGAFAMVFKVKYLLYLALFSLVFTWVNTNGEYMLGKLIAMSADALVAAGELGADEVESYIGGRFAEFFLYVNILTFLLQTFAVSRIVKYGGLKVAFFVLPVIALADATLVSIAPVLSLLFVGKVLENGTDYSLNNTVRNMLWLPTTRDMKYKAKQAVDTFFVRMGDVGSAVLVLVLAGSLALDVRWFAVANVILVGIWIYIAAQIIRENRKLSADAET